MGAKQWQPGASPAIRMILASSSPRRRELLAEAGYVFDMVSPPFVEPALTVLQQAPAQQAEALAYFKAEAVARMCPGRYILGADTIVTAGGIILGKPADQPQARQMLRALSGTTHTVITGVALVWPEGRRISSTATIVTMRQMSPGELDEYIASGEWVNKAGAYAIQETADRFITKVDGSFTNVVGLPMELVDRMVRQILGDQETP